MSANRARPEDGAESAAAIIVLPLFVVLLLGLVDVGHMISTRVMVASVTRDAVRAAAYQGGNNNVRVNRSGPVDRTHLRRLVDASGCLPSKCEPGRRPTLRCTPAVVQRAGDLVTCTATYPYRPLNGALMRGPLGLGIGTLLGPFRYELSARSEVGQS